MSLSPAYAANSPSQARRAIGRIIACASGKGGVGKTFVSIGLAHAFSKAGERVLLVDADLGMANVDVQLGVSPPGDLAAVVEKRTALEDAVAPAVADRENGRGGFDVIAGRSGSAALANLDPVRISAVTNGLSTLASKYTRVILDLGAGADRGVVQIAACADDVVLVINDEPTALTDAYAFAKVLRMSDEGAAPFIVVNGAPHQAASETAYKTFAKTCESFLGFRPPLAGFIRRDRYVGQAVRMQKALGVTYPASKAAQDLDALAAKLLKGVDAA